LMQESFNYIECTI